jgi:hypothetical protein
LILLLVGDEVWIMIIVIPKGHWLAAVGSGNYFFNAQNRNHNQQNFSKRFFDKELKLLCKRK